MKLPSNIPSLGTLGHDAVRVSEKSAGIASKVAKTGVLGPGPKALAVAVDLGLTLRQTPAGQRPRAALSVLAGATPLGDAMPALNVLSKVLKG